MKFSLSGWLAADRPQRPFPFWAVLASWGAFLGLAIYGLWGESNVLFGMYGNNDGLWAAWNLRALLNWGKFSDLSPFNPLAGMGSTFLPNLPWLNPGALAFAFPIHPDLQYVVSYFFYLSEVLVTGYFLCRTVGLSPLKSLIASGLVIIFFSPPFRSIFVSREWFSLAPVNMHLLAISNILFILFFYIGAGSIRKNVLLIAGFCGAAVVGIYSAPVTFITYLPAYVAASAFAVPQPFSRRNIFWKTGAIIALMVVFWSTGIVDYLRATSALSARAVNFPPAFAAGSQLLTWSYWEKLWSAFHVCALPQDLLCTRYKVSILFFGAIIGASATLIFYARLRIFAAWFIAFVVLIHFYALASYGLVFGSLHVISVPYLVWAANAFYVFFFAMLLFAIFDGLRYLGYIAPSGVTLLVRKLGNLPAICLAFSVPLIGLFIWRHYIAPGQPSPPPEPRAISWLRPSLLRHAASNPVIDSLAERARILPGLPFRGYAGTYFKKFGWVYTAFGDQGRYDRYTDARSVLESSYGTTFMDMDLWLKNIPTMEEYGQWITRPVWMFVHDLLREKNEAMPPYGLRIYKLDVPILEAIGVRFLVTDHELSDVPQAKLIISHTAPKAPGSIFLYQLEGSNIAGFSPTSFLKVRTFGEAIAAIGQNKTQLAHHAIVFQDLAGEFVPVTSSAFAFVRDGFTVRATSSAKSILVLPVQYSRCLKIVSNAHSNAVRLFRINAIQTGVEFERQVDLSIRFDFGPFSSSQCRLDDAADLRRLAL